MSNLIGGLYRYLGGLTIDIGVGAGLGRGGTTIVAGGFIGGT